MVYDFLELNENERYKLFSFEKRLLDRLELIVEEFLGKKPTFLPIEVEFIRKIDG